MAEVQRKLVHKQFNSPMGLYSQQNVKETLNRELQAFGSEGIEIEDARPLNLANSAVLRAVEEEEQMKCEMIEPLVKTERQSRSRQRFYQRPHTPVHQHQLEQIKTQYLSHQHDITIDRDTVLKINRLATRRNLHKREHSWPPTTMAAAACSTTSTANNEQLKNVDRNGKMLSQQQLQHIRSTSNDNALQFDETVCKRHGIDVIREKFNSPTRIIEPTAQEVRQRREQQRKLQQQKQQQQQQRSTSRSDDVGGGGGVDGGKNKPKQMINLVKHEELLRKNKSATMTDTTNVLRTNDYVELEKNSANTTSVSIPGQQTSDKSTEKECDKNLKAKEVAEDELFKTTNVPETKGFSHPETKAADEDIGLVEPKRQFYEQLASCKKWHSYENLEAAVNAKPVTNKSLLPQMHKRQAYSLERGREARQQKQLPPQKPRFSPKLQRRSMKLATEIKISYDADAQQHNIHVKSLNQPKKPQPMTLPSTTTLDDMEHIPLPATPNNYRSVPVNVEQSGEHPCEFHADTKAKSLTEQQIYDESCIYLRSIDLQDNTVAYIPAAITIVPSPTEEIMQHWMESSNLKANIKGVNDIATAGNTATKAPHELQEKNEHLISMLKHESVKSALTPEGIKHQQRHTKQQEQNAMQDAADETRAETDMYVTRLPSTPNGIQLTRQTSVNTKRKTQMNNNNDNNITNNKKPSTLAMTTEAATHEYLQQQTRPPGFIHSNAASAECNKVAREGDKIQQQGVYYTDGEYVYGPYDPYNGAPLANATVRSLQAEQQQQKQQQQQQQLHQQPQIKKDIEAETKTQHKNEIANLTAKYEHIQKSINEHLRQIDAYIENAKAALKSTITTSNKSESSSSTPIQADQQQQSLQPESHHSNLKAQMEHQQQSETPLKEILRKITNIMQEVQPLHRNQKANQKICMQEHSTVHTQQDGEENMPIVDKVLMDLNMLTKHLSEFDTTASEELKPIMEQLQQTPLDLQFETRPSVATASHVLINEETAKSHQLKEAYTSVTAKSTQPPPPPPPLPPPTTIPNPVALTKPRQHKQKEHVGDEQLLATDKLITAQIQSQQHSKQPLLQQQQKEMTMSAVTPQDMDDTTATQQKTKNFVFDFITARHEQEQLVEQVIDTLGKLENESKENLVNIHVPAHDEKIKSNLNQQTPSSSSEATTSTAIANTKNERDMAIMQNCNISVLANASGKDPCNHDNDPKSTKGNESQLKLHIKDFADKIADKQFQKYDNQLTKNTNDVVNTSSSTNSNNNKPGQRQHPYEHTKHVSSSHDDDKDEDDKDNKIKKMMDQQLQQQQQQEEEGGSNRSSGSELSNTYKSSYELPSPYVTVRQISWEDVQATATQLSTNLAYTLNQSEIAESASTASPVLTSTVNIVKPKQDIQIAQICCKSPVTLYESETTTTTPPPVTTSGHVEMQSTTTLKPSIQTRKQPQPEQKHKQQILQQHHDQTPATLDEGRKYPAPLIEPHLPTRSTSPFGLNAVELPFKQRSPSISPTRLRRIRIAQDALASATRKYPSPLVEPHLPTRATSPFGLNAVEMKNVKRSPSTSPKRAAKYTLRTSPRTVDEMAIRKYPAPLVEPHVPTRANSPFGINAVDVLHTTRATTPLPTYGLEVKSEDEQEPQYYDDDYDEHEDKPNSRIRKYPPALIEPHVPTRAASPFGLNAVETKQKARHRTPSPARGHHQHHHPHQSTTTLKSSSTASDSCKKTVAYVPQVEGHNIGLLVRTSTPIPYSHAPASSSPSEINATKTPHDYATMTVRDITGNKYCAKNNIGRDAANDDNGYVDDDEATCDEIQRINTIGSTKQGTAAAATAPATTNKTMAHHQPQKQELQQQHHESEQAHLLQQQEQYSSGGGSSGQHMAVDNIPLPTSVINRSFDNVSPRPYISIEGYKRVAWPPASEERIVREFTPQPQTQYPPAPAYNQQQQQHQPTPAAANAAAVPPTQGPIYNNVPHHAPISNTNNFARENNSPYKQTPNQSEYEAFPPQTPETPIILKDKQFSRLPSHEPNTTNSLPYQHQQQQYQQPQNQHQEHYHQEQPQYQQPLYNNQQQNYQQQQQYQANQQNVSYPQQQQQHQEDHHQQTPSGWKPIHPPQTKPDTLFTGAYGVGECAPTVATPIYQQQYQNYQQPSTNQQQQYRAPSHDNYQHPQQQQYQQPPQQQQFPPQPQYQAQAAPSAQKQYQQQPQLGSQYQQPPQQQPAWAQQQPPHQQQYQQPPWVQQPQQQQQPQQLQQQPQYQNPLNQYNQAPHHQQQYPQQQNQFVPQTNQQQFNSYSQPQQQQHTVSHDQVDQQHYQPQLPQDLRGASPGIITLRKEAPITQQPTPVYTSQPAAISYRGGSSMRGDLKWPPPEYKEAAAKENDERRKLASGPVCRPRKINRDYTTFFAKNALSHHYPSYKVPPGTQHMTY